MPAALGAHTIVVEALYKILLSSVRAKISYYILLLITMQAYSLHKLINS